MKTGTFNDAWAAAVVIELMEKFGAETNTGEDDSVGDSVGELTGDVDFALRSNGWSSAASVSDSSFLAAASSVTPRGGKYHCGTTSAGMLGGKRKFSNDFCREILLIAATAAIDAAATDEATDSKLDIEFNLFFVK